MKRSYEGSNSRRAAPQHKRGVDGDSPTASAFRAGPWRITARRGFPPDQPTGRLSPLPRNDPNLEKVSRNHFNALRSRDRSRSVTESGWGFLFRSTMVIPALEWARREFGPNSYWSFKRGIVKANLHLSEQNAARHAFGFRCRLGVIHYDLGGLLRAAGEFRGRVSHLNVAGIGDRE